MVLKKKTVKFGSNLNELMRGNMRDTEADQRAIFSGFNFKGYTKWKKNPIIFQYYVLL